MDECPKTDVDSCSGRLPIEAERNLNGDGGRAQIKGEAKQVREAKCIADGREGDPKRAERDAERLKGAVERESERAAEITGMEPETEEGEWKMSGMETVTKLHTRVELKQREKYRAIAQIDVVYSEDAIVARFVRRLAEFYKAKFEQASAFDESRMENICFSLRADDSSVLIDHVGLIEKFRSETSVTLVVGKTGAGKTTFFDRIAYDWAHHILRVNKSKSWLRGLFNITSPRRNFSWIGLVIVANLGTYRPVDDTTSLIEFALRSCKVVSGDYEQSYDVRRLANFFDRHENLLICLDGLDEYTGDSEVLLRCLKANRHHKVIVTSRPSTNVDVFATKLSPDRYHFQPLTDSQIRSFVKSHCKLPVAQHAVKECLRGSEVLFRVPLILSFACRLANDKKEISANLTQVYDQLVTRFIWKPNGIPMGATKSITNLTDSADWKMLPEAKRLCRLAFCGCQEVIYEFSMDDTTRFGVTKDISKLGIFIRRSNFKAEFLHPSVQEYFAAQKCYDDILSDDSNSD